MKNASLYAKRLGHLLSRLKKTVGELPEPAERPPLHQLIYAFLSYNATRKQAGEALGRLVDSMVDLNELRVSDDPELIEAIGRGYPHAADRVHRLKAALNTIYRREHAVDLEPLAKLPKKDARAYLEGLDGMVPYVAAAVALACYHCPVVGVDDDLLKRLIADAIVPPDATAAMAGTFIEHHIRAEQAMATHLLLRAYVEKSIKVQIPGPIPKPPTPPAAPPAPKPQKNGKAHPAAPAPTPVVKPAPAKPSSAKKPASPAPVKNPVTKSKPAVKSAARAKPVPATAAKTTKKKPTRKPANSRR